MFSLGQFSILFHVVFSYTSLRKCPLKMTLSKYIPCNIDTGVLENVTVGHETYRT